jgi:hypothetical protein
MVWLLPRVFATLPQPAGATPTPPGFDQLIIIFLALFEGFFLVVLPAIWLIFYAGKNVRATCEARHPQTSCTDHCPLPVLALSLFFGFSALILLAASAGGLHAFPAFGIMVTGWPVSLVMLIFAAFWMWVARELYRLQTRAWWSALAAHLLMTVSCLVTYLRIDLHILHLQMNILPEQIAQMEKVGVSWLSLFIGITLCSGTVILLWLLLVKKYFRRS